MSEGITNNRTSQRFYSLDALRGLCCLMIVAFHSILWAAYASHSTETNAISEFVFSSLMQLRLAVPFFFVISGFCIAHSAASSSKPSSAGSFAFRRFIRIYPPFWICLAIHAIIFILLNQFGLLHWCDSVHAKAITPGQLSLVQIAGNLTLTETWRQSVFGGPPAEMNLLGQMWTLCYEEQFYLFTFLCILLPRRFFSIPFIALSIYLLTSTTSFSLSSAPIISRFYNFAHQYTPTVDGTFIDVRFLEFSFGVAAYFICKRNARGLRCIPYLLCITIPVLMLLPEFLIGSKPSHLDHIAAGFFSLMLIVLHPLDSKLIKLSVFRGLSYFGRRCYSIYLTHAYLVTAVSKLFITWGATSLVTTICLTLPTCLLASTIVGHTFHRYVEHTFLKYSKLGRVAAEIA